MPAFKDWEEEEKLKKSLGSNGQIHRNNMQYMRAVQQKPIENVKEEGQMSNAGGR